MAIVFEFELFDLLLHAARIDYENTYNLREVLILLDCINVIKVQIMRKLRARGQFTGYQNKLFRFQFFDSCRPSKTTLFNSC